ncbi:MAG TPA: DUF424 domain-containing protein [Candidatus Nitrosopolaris sp.]|nr:DUF424 domain-containing protein [Candidatus Nitrosopolaris sp.]
MSEIGAVGGKYAMRWMDYQGSTMVNICDLELIGTQIEQDKFVINLTKGYFQREIIEDLVAEKLLLDCSIANLVGQRIVDRALKLKLAKEASIKRISGVPFLMIYKFHYR